MQSILLLLNIMGAIAGVDVVIFHILKYRLHTRYPCRWEVLSHAFHGFSAAAFYVLCTLDARGAWAGLYLFAAAFQTANQTVDTLIEPNSRRHLGGIPEDEYRMHGVLNFLWGAIIILMVVHGITNLSGPSSITVSWETIPGWLQPSVPVGVGACLGFAFLDTVSFVGLMRRGAVTA